MGFPWNFVRVGESLMEVVSQGELHWSHGFLVVVVRSGRVIGSAISLGRGGKRDQRCLS